MEVNKQKNMKLYNGKLGDIRGYSNDADIHQYTLYGRYSGIWFIYTKDNNVSLRMKI